MRPAVAEIPETSLRNINYGRQYTGEDYYKPVRPKSISKSYLANCLVYGSIIVWTIWLLLIYTTAYWTHDLTTFCTLIIVLVLLFYISKWSYLTLCCVIHYWIVTQFSRRQFANSQNDCIYDFHLYQCNVYYWFSFLTFSFSIFARHIFFAGYLFPNRISSDTCAVSATSL